MPKSYFSPFPSGILNRRRVLTMELSGKQNTVLLITAKEPKSSKTQDFLNKAELEHMAQVKRPKWGHPHSPRVGLDSYLYKHTLQE